MAETGEGAAIVMRQYGGPDVVRLEDVPLVVLEPDEIRIRSIASAVNHSDPEIRAANWPILRPDPFPYTPGLEVAAGAVASGPANPGVRRCAPLYPLIHGLARDR